MQMGTSAKSTQSGQPGGQWLHFNANKQTPKADLQPSFNFTRKNYKNKFVKFANKSYVWSTH
jgi:hypothetical protein